MTIDPKVWNFPTFPISKQLFYVPGLATEGGFTSGGARISTREPGGFSRLELQPSLQVREWDYPISSWLMSKNNGDIFRIRLAPNPQVSTARLIRNHAGNVPWDAGILWNNLQEWQGDISAVFATDANEGETQVVIDLSTIGQILQIGHVFGHNNDTYLVDEIEYDESNIATITPKPSPRRNILAGETAYLRPFFTGQIMNGDEIRAMYEASNNGAIQPGRIVFGEVIL